MRFIEAPFAERLLGNGRRGGGEDGTQVVIRGGEEEEEMEETLFRRGMEGGSYFAA